MREWRQGEYRITTDPAMVDLDVVHGFLAESYWAKDIPREVVKRSIQHSLNFSLYLTHLADRGAGSEAAGGSAANGGRQIGFARVVTDFATVAYLGDVFVLEPYRGRGLSKWLLQVVVGHPELQGFRRWILLTRDAHALYRRVGFTGLAKPERWMERWAPETYARR